MLKLSPIKDQFDRVFSTKHARQFRMGVFRTKQFLDHNMSLILLLAVVLFGYSILDVQRGNRAILEGQEQNRNRQTQLVEQFLGILKDDTDQILNRVERSESLQCAIILLHDIDIQLPGEIRERCELELRNRTTTLSLQRELQIIGGGDTQMQPPSSSSPAPNPSGRIVETECPANDKKPKKDKR